MIASLFRVTLAAVAVSLVGTGCSKEMADRQPIPPAPVGVPSAGIGAPGGGSADTRGTGTVASGEGDEPIGLTTPAGATVSNAVPGAAEPQPGSRGLH